MVLATSSSMQQAAQRCHCRPFTTAVPKIARTRSSQRAAAARNEPGATAAAAAASQAAAGQKGSRRQVLSSPLLLSSALLAQQALAAMQPAASWAEEGFGEITDPTLAYSFKYPTATASGVPLQMTLTHAPEKYSSAAPLTADARQRIVYERFDLSKFVTVSMTVGPASGVLKGEAPGGWRPKDVALTVLIDRSTARLSSGQRTALNDVESVAAVDREGSTYWVYEHISQGSPTPQQQRSTETYRHALAVTAVRPASDGTPFLYTLNLSCPEALWADLQPQFQASIDSFRLVEPGQGYIPPDQNPWLFF